MGGTGIALRPAFNLNISNPASYSSLLLTEFEVAASASFTRMSTSNLSQKKSEETFSYFALGFPVVNKKWGAAFGLIPFSNVGYKIAAPETDINAGDILYTYQGTGGINRLFIGNAFTIKKNLSAGFHASYLFGSLDRVSTAEFSETSFFNSRFTATTQIHDFYFDFGLQYVFDSLKIAKSDSLKMYDKIKKNLKDSVRVLAQITDSISRVQNNDSSSIKMQRDTLEKNISELKIQILQVDSARKKVVNKRQKSDWSLTGGFTLAPPSNISASQDSLIERYQGNGNFILVRDTILDKEGDKGNIKLPLTLGFGVSLKKGNRWLIAADVAMQSWQDYSYFGQKDSLRNSLRMSAGMQYTPDERGIKSYWQTVQYRLGAFYNQTYLQLRGTKLNEYGVTAGLGLPIRKGLSAIQFSAMLGTRGTTSNSLIKEDFVRFSIGVTFSDRWFIKPKYD